MKKILNLYSGIGGNRKNWSGDIQVTAVEKDPQIADIYSNFYPDDILIVGDAHKYLLEYYRDFDFIWSSPPCQTHSDIRRMGAVRGLYPAVYPDISLWEEINLLKHFRKKPWVVENVNIYYEPIIQPSFRLDRHLFWANFYAPNIVFKGRGVPHKKINGWNSTIHGINISGFKCQNKRHLLRNMVNPDVGEYIYNVAMGQEIKNNQIEMF